jgi:hypothetical protein
VTLRPDDQRSGRRDEPPDPMSKPERLSCRADGRAHALGTAGHRSTRHAAAQLDVHRWGRRITVARLLSAAAGGADLPSRVERRGATSNDGGHPHSGWLRAIPGYLKRMAGVAVMIGVSPIPHSRGAYRTTFVVQETLSSVMSIGRPPLVPAW